MPARAHCEVPVPASTPGFARGNKLQDGSRCAFYYGDLQSHVHTGECQEWSSYS